MGMVERLYVPSLRKLAKSKTAERARVRVTLY